MKAADFDYYRVDTLEDAIERLGELGEDAKVLAGGQSLVPMMNFRLARPAALVDITRVPELRGISRGNGELRIRAATTHAEVEHAAELEEAQRPAVAGLDRADLHAHRAAPVIPVAALDARPRQALDHLFGVGDEGEQLVRLRVDGDLVREAHAQTGPQTSPGSRERPRESAGVPIAPNYGSARHSSWTPLSARR